MCNCCIHAVKCKNEKYYTGIGSRDCPNWITEIIIKTSSWLSNKGYIVRSGGADGSDFAFEKGADLVDGKKEIYLPWRKFNKSESNFYLTDNYNEPLEALAKHYHPNFNALSSGAKKLHMRNCHQILGSCLKNPSMFVLCYTKNGSGAGGTGQALRISKDYGIPIFDFGCYKDKDECRKAFMDFMKIIEEFEMSSHIKRIEKTLINRGVTGDKLLDAIDIANDILRVSGEVTDRGIAYLYHRTDTKSAFKIRNECAMTSEEDGIFMSTHSDKQITGYGNTILRIEVPIEKIVLDDEFADELHYKIPTKLKETIFVKADIK